MRIREAILKEEQVPSGYTLVDDILYYNGQYVLSKASTFIVVLLREYHDSPVGGHAGELKTYLRLATEWFWEGMKRQVLHYVRECKVCQQAKASYQSPARLLQNLPIPSNVWEHITKDFIEGVPKSDGVDTILVVVDRLTKFGHFISLKHPFTAATMAAKFVTEIVRLHGFLTSIVSDRDKIFISSFWRELFRLQHTQLLRSTAFHPQTDGQSEIVNKVVETYLQCFANEQPRRWAKWLHWAEFSYNNSPHVSTKMSPFQALYGRVPPHIVRMGHRQTPVDSLDQLLQERDAILEELQFNLLKAQHRMCQYANKKRREGKWNIRKATWCF